MSATKLLVVLLIAALAVDMAVSKDPQAAPAAAGVVPVSLGRRLLRGARAAAVATRNMLQVSRLTCKMHILLLLCLWGACAGLWACGVPVPCLWGACAVPVHVVASPCLWGACAVWACGVPVPCLCMWSHHPWQKAHHAC